MKGLNTIIPNLLKVSEQEAVGYHIYYGSLSVLAAGLSWVAQCRWRLVVLCRQSMDGLHVVNGLLCLCLFNKNEAQRNYG